MTRFFLIVIFMLNILTEFSHMIEGFDSSSDAIVSGIVTAVSVISMFIVFFCV